jgi:arylformamidase
MSGGWVDVSHPLWHRMPRLELLPEVEIDTYVKLSEGAHVTSSVLTVPLHAGTHIDAPCHIVEGGKSIDEIPPERFRGPGVIAAVRRRPGELITVDDVLNGGPEPQTGDMLFIDSGWGELFESREYHDHPSVDPELAEWAVERGLSLLGVDFLSPDLPLSRRGTPPDLKVHKTLLASEVLIAENLVGLHKLPPQRLNIWALPVLVRGGDAGHARILIELP